MQMVLSLSFPRSRHIRSGVHSVWASQHWRLHCNENANALKMRVLFPFFCSFRFYIVVGSQCNWIKALKLECINCNFYSQLLLLGFSLLLRFFLSFFAHSFIFYQSQSVRCNLQCALHDMFESIECNNFSLIDSNTMVIYFIRPLFAVH